MSSAGGARQGILSLAVKDKAALYNAYMPYIRNGGIFVPTPRRYFIGDEVFLLLQLLDDPTRHPVAGKVAWITPQGAQGGKTQGIGVHFSDDESSKVLRGRIEQILAGHLNSARPTHTL